MIAWGSEGLATSKFKTRKQRWAAARARSSTGRLRRSALFARRSSPGPPARRRQPRSAAGPAPGGTGRAGRRAGGGSPRQQGSYAASAARPAASVPWASSRAHPLAPAAASLEADGAGERWEAAANRPFLLLAYSIVPLISHRAG